MLVINKSFRVTCREHDDKTIEEIFKECDVHYFNKRYSALDNHDLIIIVYENCSCLLENYKILCNKLQESPTICSITE